MKIYVTFRYKLFFIIALEVTSHVFDVLIMHVTFTVGTTMDTCIHVLFTAITNRPYALTSHLHNNDAMLGVNTCRAARTCCAGRALALSQCAGPAVWHAGVGPLAACLRT